MNSRYAVLPVAAALAAGGFAASVALGGDSATVTVKSAFVKGLAKTALVNKSGLTLYRNASEKGGRIRCTGPCAAAWPPLLVAAGDRVAAGPGVAQTKLSTVTRPDGKRQVAYRGMPLYRFASDRKPGDAKGQGLGGVWFAVALAGGSAPGATTPGATPAPPPPPATTTDTGYTYGY